MSAERALLVITDPAARSADGESVRVALDVLRAAAPAKIVVPDSRSELERALARRGRRRVVVVAGDAGVHAVARSLERHGELGETPLGIVPVDTGGGHGLADTLCLPAEPAKAARVALGEHERPFDLLMDDLGDIALRSVRIGHGMRAGSPGTGVREAAKGWRGLLDRAARTVTTTVGAAVGPSGHRLRVEADGRVVADIDRPVLGVHLGCDGGDRDRDGGQTVRHMVSGTDQGGAGTASVMITPGSGRFGLPPGPRPRHREDGGGRRAGEGVAREPLVQLRAREITVCGRDFTYAADGMATGPVRLRTWRVRTTGWRLYVPG